ncbi:ribosome small subunit-dependent GTPase A [Candidatus Kaiserbacteria bacterium]|nr:ribosome small subunit-dependent GTPase A [Candidatus Kaiserbacteria bacterium]
MNTETGRVIEVQRIHNTVVLSDGSLVLATVRGEFHETGEYPKVGDYVRISRVEASEEAQAVIEEILPRQTVIERYDELGGQPQVLVANVDVVFIVMGLDGDFNLSRLERYLALAAHSHIVPVIVLNKADVTDELEAQTAAVVTVAPGIPLYTVVATTGEGLAAVREHITPDTTAVLLGSSGAGKSTITNWLLGRFEQEIGDVRADDSKGRHTTTTRQLFALPTGGFLIDTPGMRELALADDGEEDEVLIEQVEQFARQCTFSNCDHEKSAGCAVLAAVASGELSERALHNYQKLKLEQDWQATHADKKTRYAAEAKKRSLQAKAAARRRRLMR